MTKLKPWLLAGCAITAAMSAAPALAQQAPPAPKSGDQDVTVVEELVVTSERREQKLKDVPVAVTAFSDKTRDNVGLLTIQSMAQFTPGVTYNTGNDRPSIRGIGRQSNTFSIESPVANYWDGVYTSSVQDASRRPMFIDRVEILRGPQGALSGKGSVAGAVNVISKRPRGAFEGEVGVQAGNYERGGIEGTISGPITDWLRYRINAGKYVQTKGYFKNLATGSTEGDQPNNRQIQDYMLAGDITDKFDFFLKASFADYTETRANGSNYVNNAPYSMPFDACNPSPFQDGAQLVPNVAFGAFGPGVGCGTTGAFNNNANAVGGIKQNPAFNGDLRNYAHNSTNRQWLTDHHTYVAEFVFHAPIADIKYIGGHQNYRYDQYTDYDLTPINRYTLPGPSFAPTATRVVDPSQEWLYMEDREWYSHELNLTSTKDAPLQWLLGLYVSRENYTQQPQTLFARGYPELNTPVAGSFFVNYTPVAVQPNAVPYAYQYGQLWGINDSKAVFGQVEYKLNEKWKITVGGRYNADEKNVTEKARYLYNNFAWVYPVAVDVTSTGYSVVGANANVPAGYTAVALDSTTKALLAPGVVGLPTVDADGNRTRDMHAKWTATLGTAGIDYTPNEDQHYYFRFTQTYRPGGFNAGFLFLTPEVDKENVNSYELGAKLTLANQLQVNTALFTYDYKNIQLPLATLERCLTPGDPSTCVVVNSFTNVPAARNSGFELEATWFASKDFQMLFSYGYLNTRITEGRTANGFINTLDPAALGDPTKRMSVAGTDQMTGLPIYTQDLTGNPLPNAPRHKLAVNANYTFHVKWGDLTASASYLWRASSLSNPFGFKPDSTPSSDQLNARLVFRDSDRKYQITAYIDNILNKDIAEGGSAARAPIGSPNAANQAYYRSYTLAPPRTFGVEMSRKF